MKVLILTLLILATVFAGGRHRRGGDYDSLCDCPRGKYFHPNDWSCNNNPHRDNDGYIDGCYRYDMVGDGYNDMVCSECDDGYYPEYDYGDYPVRCVKTNIRHCLEYGHYRNRNSYSYFGGYYSFWNRYLPYGRAYECLRCAVGRYWNGRYCARNPRYGRYYIDNCRTYSRSSSSHSSRYNRYNRYSRRYSRRYLCEECDSGYYLSSNQRECIRNPIDDDNDYDSHCDTYAFDYHYDGPRCTKCEDDYYLHGDDHRCRRAYEIMDHCDRGHFESRRNRFECDRCQDDYYLTHGDYKCNSNPIEGDNYYVDHCHRYRVDEYDNMYCDRCKGGYSLKHGHCEDIDSDYDFIDHCDSYVTSHGKRRCYGCEDGYRAANYPTDSCNSCPYYED